VPTHVQRPPSPTLLPYTTLFRSDEVRSIHRNEPLLVGVGAEKVPFDVYETADYNVAVTGQPHSEVASLAVFLDHLFAGRELDREWQNAKRKVVPKAHGKRVEDTDDG